MTMIPAALITLLVGFCSLSTGMLLNAGLVAPRDSSTSASVAGRALLIGGGVVMVAGFLLGAAAIGLHVPDPSGHVFQY